MNDEFCVCGNRWTEVFNTSLHSDCYYCPHCDKIYEMSAREVTREYFDRNYTSNRFEQIKMYALIKEARKQVSLADLRKLGYLAREGL